MKIQLHTNLLILLCFSPLAMMAQTFNSLQTTLPALANSVIAMGDADNDGDLDAYLSGVNNQDITVGGLYIYNEGQYELVSSSNLPAVSNGSARWADYNNDSFLDLLIQGFNTESEGYTKVHINNGDNTFTALEQDLPPMYLGEVAMVDINNDNLIDISLTGIETETWTFVTKLFINNGDNSVTELINPITIPGMNFGRIKWADYNDDNFNDFVLSGYNTTDGEFFTHIYTNNSDNTFTKSNINLQQCWLGDTEWGDYNNDGHIDLVISGAGGTSGAERFTEIYKNNGDSTFTNIDTNIPGVSHSSIEWADFNMDGNLDLFITGSSATPGAGSYVYHIFNNMGEDNFTQSNTAILSASYYGDAAVGDINNDGKPDVVVTGLNENNNKATSVFLNTTTDSLTFTETSTVVDNFFYPSTDWGDYDNDGNLDLIISGAIDTTGDYSPNESAVRLYKNNNGVLSEISTPTITNVHLGFVKFIDIDNDGDLDLLVSGQNYSDLTSYFFTVYENVNNTFVTKQQLEGVILGSIDFGDYDNDGDLDLLVTGGYQASTGASSLTRIYTNTDGTFADASAGFIGLQNGNAQFGDLDNDDDLDILVMGLDENYSPTLKTYFNTNAIFTEQQNLPGLYYGSFALGDFDNDDDIDFSVIGDDINGDYKAKIYSNTNGTFTEFTTLAGMDVSSGTTPIAWGDYDNDGDLDLVVSGSDVNYNDVTILYKNENNVFTQTDEGLTNLGGGTSLFWADYDNDNDLDILISGFFDDANYASKTVLHTNTTPTANLKPIAPTNLSSVINPNNSITFIWDNGTDDHTPENGLYYWLTIGTTQNGQEVASYKVHGNSWTLNNLTASNYYWSVQSVDTSFILSDKAEEGTLSTTAFEVKNPSFKMFPNPSVNKQVNITFDFLKHTNTSIAIYDISGQIVYESFLENTNNILNLSSLASGVYVIKLASNQFQTIKKLILR
ncbi:T9SS type A sorting domain-containing protein [Bizionia saleffrena]|uniref:T9SS type A sorting domain-containing protein n=1 Tax=Bizionia saleffrena TaxID=291189 RepID=A0A8H2LDM2_9FLAO|nr:T9SS type A sorting domain-containing protein [Bizionia saleffrena]TYB75940.1 T9SS type A sorting domain-containing protein [Bizionia saleffrena]